MPFQAQSDVQQVTSNANRSPGLIIQRNAAEAQHCIKVMNVEELFLNAEDCGTLSEVSTPLPPAVVETMKIVFRETHGGEMTPEDREFLGIADQ